jgi:hypothetical protein
LEDSEDCRSVGGHGNQHVRLRSAQIDFIETICPALAALRCFEPRQTSGSRFSGSGFQDTASRPHSLQRLIGKSANSANSSASKTCRSAKVSGFGRRSVAIRSLTESVVVAVLPPGAALQLI